MLAQQQIDGLPLFFYCDNIDYGLMHMDFFATHSMFISVSNEYTGAAHKIKIFSKSWFISLIPWGLMIITDN